MEEGHDNRDENSGRVVKTMRRTTASSRRVVKMTAMSSRRVVKTTAMSSRRVVKTTRRTIS